MDRRAQRCLLCVGSTDSFLIACTLYIATGIERLLTGAIHGWASLNPILTPQVLSVLWSVHPCAVLIEWRLGLLSPACA